MDLVAASALTLTGRHNALNALAALALADAMGIAGENVIRPLCEFRGLAHRMALVAEVRGVVYVDDSKSTTVASTIAALEGMRRKSVLIAGGDAKGQDFIPLVPAVRNHARAVVLLGRDAPLLERALRAAGVDLVSADRHRRSGGPCLGHRPARRCGAPLAGLRELGHVPRLCRTRRPVCVSRAGAADGG